MKHFWIIALACLAFASSTTAAAQRHTADSESQFYTYVRLPISQVTKDFVKASGFIRDHRYDKQFAYGYLAKNRLSDTYFAEKNISFVKEEPKNANGYHDYAQLSAKLQNIANSNADIVRLYSAGTSVEGRQLWYVKISDKAQKNEHEPKFLYIANMHGDEVVGREMMIKLIDKITTEYATNMIIRDLVDHSQIYIMPSMNPDGFENKTRFNKNHSDLNRDFPDFISDRNDTPNGRQKETAAIMRLHENNHFAIALNFHGGDVCFNLPWDTKRNTAGDKFADDPLLSFLARSYANANPVMVRQNRGSFDRGITYGYEWYEVDGGMQDWADYYRRSAHATVELSFKKWPPASQLEDFWADNEAPMINHLVKARNGIHLNVKSHGQDVFVSIDGRKLKYTSLEAHSIHRVALEGSHRVAIEAAGYQKTELDMNSWVFNDNHYEIELQKQ